MIKRIIKLLFNRHPSFVNIETSSQCNRACLYCPNAYYQRPDVRMDVVDISKILKSLSNRGYYGTIRFWGMNEPLMDLRIFDIIRLSKSILPSSPVELATNGDLLTREALIKLSEARLDRLTITRHSQANGCESTEECGNMTIVDQPRIEYVFNRCGAVPFLGGQKVNRCLLQDEININVDGRMRFCCNDYFGSTGNALTSDPLEVWHEKRYWLNRILPALGVKSGPCKSCRVKRSNEL